MSRKPQAPHPGDNSGMEKPVARRSSRLAFVFMNENLLMPRSRKPKITILFPTGQRLHVHSVMVHGRVVTGRKDVGTHVLKAWIEALPDKIVW